MLDNNDFSILDIRNGNNSNFTMFNITNNPTLTCVFVDDAVWSETNWSAIDNTSTYVETEAECDALGIDDEDFTQNISLYPNPTSSIVHIKIKNTVLIQEIHIHNVLGKTIQKQINHNTINFSNLPTGVYFVTIIDNNAHKTTHKVVKK